MMRRTWTTKILGAVAARLLLTTVDQVHHYDLQETNKTGEGADREPEGGPDQDQRPQAHGEGADQEPEGGHPGQPEERDLPGSRHRTLKQLVRRAHEGLGHPNVDRFVRILKSAKATGEVLDIARNLKCSVCDRFAQTRPQRRAAPPREYGLNEVSTLSTGLPISRWSSR